MPRNAHEPEDLPVRRPTASSSSTGDVRLTRDRGIGLLVITHSQPLAKRLCDDIVHLDRVNAMR